MDKKVTFNNKIFFMYMYKNYFNKTLKKCSVKPMTGYNRDGYCRPDKRDHGKHLVCAKVNKKFLDYTAKKKITCVQL